MILNNLKKALELYPELRISVRINVDKTNINRLDEIEYHFKEYGLLNKVAVYIAPVMNINGTCTDRNCFNAKEYNSWVIDPKGDFYKCWDDIGDLSEKVGSAFQENFEINEKLLKWLSYSIEDDERCVQCPYLPICMGTC